jgi:hypothetical protein
MKGKILEAARYGIWSFHHDDETLYRGVPTGFWEILFNDPVNAAILQRLTPTLDGGIILHKGYFGTVAHSWSGNLDKLLKSTVEWPARVCKQIENEGFPTHSEKQQTLSPLRFLPGNWVMFRFLLKTARNRLLFHLRDLFFSEHWQIGYRLLDDNLFNPQSESQIPDLQWVNIDLPTSVYLADPFGFCRNGIIHLLCEYYDYRNPKGKIVSIKIDASTNKILQHKVALEKDYHLAFPYLFEYEGDMYCLPENSAGGSVDLYKYDPESGQLVFEKTLIENLQAVDTVLFEYENRWWLLFTDRVSTNERLNIWFSGQLTGVYTPHPLNPVKTDIRSSRPAGQPFVRNGNLYRPAQDCSLRSGWRIAVNQIDTLTETSFGEHTVTQIEAPCLPSGLAGIHTLALSHNLLVADAKKEVFIAASFIRKFKQRIHKVLKINK